MRRWIKLLNQKQQEQWLQTKTILRTNDLNVIKLSNCLKTPPQIALSSFLLVRFQKLIVVQFAILIQVVLLDCLNLSVFNSYHLIDKLFSGNNSELIFDKKQTHPMNPGFYVRLTKSTSFIESFFFASFSSPWENKCYQKQHECSVFFGFLSFWMYTECLLTANTHLSWAPLWCIHPCSGPLRGNRTHCN